jgi:putative nucleotidyltransferase with HDIG domain
MKRILFVDDDANVLEGLRRMLHPFRAEWQMAFARSGPEALEKLDAESFHVVVTDMRMPGMDGAQLLAEVKRRHPQTVRIVLSGHSDKEMILRSVGPAHQYLAKPCDADTLRTLLARACALRELLANESLKRLVTRMSALPSLPNLYAEIVAELQSPTASIQKVGQIISKDVGMTAKILQLVNSAFFGLRRHVSHPAVAAGLLGLETIKSLVLSVHVFSRFEQAKVQGFNLTSVWNHSLATGTLAKEIAGSAGLENKLGDHAMMAGLLHDAGKLVLATGAPEPYQEAVSLARGTGTPLWRLEREVLGTTHAEVGAYLMGLWGLPDPIVEAIAYHHTPSTCLAKDFGPLTAVHVASALEHEAHPADNHEGSHEISAEYLTGIRLADRLEDWRGLSRRVLEGKQGEGT